MFNLQTIDDAGNIEGKKVLLRLDLNTPIEDGRITDTYRIDKVITTIDTLRLKKAKVIIIAHIETKENPTLLPVWDYLSGFMHLKFCPTYFTKEADQMVSELEEGEVLLFENVRMNAGEKKNDPEFTEKLSKYGDIYVNDAFSVSHRPHASIIGLPKILPHYAGPLLMEEVKNLSKSFAPEHPFLFILGGAKFDTKLPLIQKFLKTADSVFVGGALATNILKEKGFEIGKSLLSDGEFGIGEMLKDSKFKYPTDVTVKNDEGVISIKKTDSVLPDEYIADCGPETIEMLKSEVKTAKFVLWNGPLGNYEIGFKDKTEQLAEVLAESGAETVVGGGDTLSAIQSMGVMEKFSFVSTAGGAMLDFLANETLPGIEALT
jgi:phosphoglycerate kinase